MLSIVIQHGDRRAAANLLVRGPGQEAIVIAPGCAQQFALEAGQALELTLSAAAAPAADEAAASTEDPT